MKRNKLSLIIIVIGILVLMYPIASNIIASHNQSTAISNYKEQVEEMKTEDVEEERGKAKEYNNSLSDEESISIEINKAKEKEEETNEGVSYLNVLDIGGTIGYITIPKIEVKLPIYHGTSENVLQSGVGHVEDSSLPIGEEGTHAILAGHTGLIRTKLFDDIDELEIGDKFYIHVLDEDHVYEVDQIKVVEPDDNKYVGIEYDKACVTLLTCVPYGINSHRLLVRGTRIEEKVLEEKLNVEDINQNIQTQEQTQEVEIIDRNYTNIKYKEIIIYLIVIMIVLIILLIIIKKKKKTTQT